MLKDLNRQEMFALRRAYDEESFLVTNDHERQLALGLQVKELAEFDSLTKMGMVPMTLTKKGRYWAARIKDQPAEMPCHQWSFKVTGYRGPVTDSPTPHLRLAFSRNDP